MLARGGTALGARAGSPLRSEDSAHPVSERLDKATGKNNGARVGGEPLQQQAGSLFADLWEIGEPDGGQVVSPKCLSLGKTVLLA